MTDYMTDYTPAVRSLERSIRASSLKCLFAIGDPPEGYDNRETQLYFHFGDQNALMAYHNRIYPQQTGLPQIRTGRDYPRLQIHISYTTPRLHLDEWRQQHTFDEFVFPEETTGIRGIRYHFNNGGCWVTATPTPFGTLGDVKLWTDSMDESFRTQIAGLLIDNNAIIRKNPYYHDTEFKEPFPQSILVDFLLEKLVRLVR